MGQPNHYSIELPERRLQLIEGLWEQAERIHDGNRPDLGPLTTTFPISMAMLIINLPIERIERHINKDPGYSDDRKINEKAVEAFDTVVRKGTLAAAPFYEDRAWSFLALHEEPIFNIADGIPQKTADRLGSDEAIENARQMFANQWVSILRNALAHGSIVYLDEYGRSSHGRPVKMYAFVSGKYGRRDCQHGEGHCTTGLGNLEGLNILRIREDNFRSFLRKWAEWLQEP